MGTVLIDHQVVLDQFPEPDTKCEALWDRLQVGGPVPTALALLSHWQHACSLVGSWGDDWYGQLVDRDLDALDIDTSAAVRVSGGRSGFAQVWVDQQAGTRTICSLRPEPSHSLLTKTTRALLPRCRLLHVDGWPAQCALDTARAMRESGGDVSIDTGSMKPTTRELLKLARVINCPRHFLVSMFGSDDIQHARGLLQWEADLVTVTDGAQGAWLFTRTEHWHQPAIDVQAVDTTGAGDVFSGGLLHGWLNQHAPRDALRIAVAAAGLKCREFGNREALPGLAETLQAAGIE